MATFDLGNRLSSHCRLEVSAAFPICADNFGVFGDDVACASHGRVLTVQVPLCCLSWVVKGGWVTGRFVYSRHVWQKYPLLSSPIFLDQSLSLSFSSCPIDSSFLKSPARVHRRSLDLREAEARHQSLRLPNRYRWVVETELQAFKSNIQNYFDDAKAWYVAWVRD